MKIFISGILLMASMGASANNIAVGTSINQWSDVDSGYGDLSFTLPTLNFTYENNPQDNLRFQAKIGFGLSDDSDNDEDGDSYDVKIKNLIQIKGLYFFNDSIYAAATYTRYKLDFYSEYDDESISDSDKDFGFQLGLRLNNLELYAGPTFSKDDKGENVEFGFNYFF
jgi:hypothetical protein